MAIAIHDEQIITLSEAARLPCFRPRRRGKKPCLQTLYRWVSRRGSRGVVLESVQIGGTTCTSMEAITRWCERLTASRNGEPMPVRSTKQREREIARADMELAAAGI